jgi:hypothetical protein
VPFSALLQSQKPVGISNWGGLELHACEHEHVFRSSAEAQAVVDQLSLWRDDNADELLPLLNQVDTRHSTPHPHETHMK